MQWSDFRIVEKCRTKKRHFQLQFPRWEKKLDIAAAKCCSPISLQGPKRVLEATRQPVFVQWSVTWRIERSIWSCDPLLATSGAFGCMGLHFHRLVPHTTVQKGFNSFVGLSGRARKRKQVAKKGTSSSWMQPETRRVETYESQKLRSRLLQTITLKQHNPTNPATNMRMPRRVFQPEKNPQLQNPHNIFCQLRKDTAGFY